MRCQKVSRASFDALVDLLCCNGPVPRVRKEPFPPWLAKNLFPVFVRRCHPAKQWPVLSCGVLTTCRKRSSSCTSPREESVGVLAIAGTAAPGGLAAGGTWSAATGKMATGGSITARCVTSLGVPSLVVGWHGSRCCHVFYPGVGVRGCSTR